jgi:hypothetical protein
MDVVCWDEVMEAVFSRPHMLKDRVVVSPVSPMFKAESEI